MATAKKADLKVKSTNFTGDDGKLIYLRAHYDYMDGKPTSYPPTSHEHDDRYMRFMSRERLQGSSYNIDNMNDPAHAGFWNVKCQSGVQGTFPSGIGYDAVLLVYPWDSDNYATQEITETATSGYTRRWIRKCNAGVWSPWEKIALVSDIEGFEKHDIILIPDTAFTITQAYLNKTLIITSSSNVTITVPTQIVENIEKGFFCDIVRYGTGEVTFSGTGIVLNSAGALSIDAQFIASSLIKIDNNNEWLLIGGRA